MVCVFLCVLLCLKSSDWFGVGVWYSHNSCAVESSTHLSAAEQGTGFGSVMAWVYCHRKRRSFAAFNAIRRQPHYHTTPLHTDPHIIL